MQISSWPEIEPSRLPVKHDDKPVKQFSLAQDAIRDLQPISEDNTA